MNLLDTPHDHKTIIYSYLNISDLLSLGTTCKNMNKDSALKNIICMKILKLYLYRDVKMNIVKDWNLFHSSICPKEIYHQQIIIILKKVNIKDIEHYEAKNFKSGMEINHHAISKSSLNDKLEIIENLVNYLFSLWRYAEEKSQDMKSLPSFDYYKLFNSIENILNIMFIHDCHQIRLKIMNELVSLNQRTKDSKKLIDVSRNHHQRYNYDLFHIDTNQYNYLYFIKGLNIFCYWTNDLDTIIDIGIFFGDYNPLFLYFYLYEIFNPFLTINGTHHSLIADDYIEDFCYKLEEKYHMDMTYKDKLFELFTLANYMIHDEFENVIEQRIQIRNEYSMDIDDYDY